MFGESSTIMVCSQGYLKGALSSLFTHWAFANQGNSVQMGERTVLAVDDEPANLELIQMAVEESGLAVHLVAARDGVEALARARELRPALVFMDLKMAGLDGWTATRRLKADPLTSAIPVIALSAHAMAGDRERALAAGCDGYMTKPLDVRAFVVLLRQYLG